jgi:FkbM family methyltransferase
MRSALDMAASLFERFVRELSQRLQGDPTDDDPLSSANMGPEDIAIDCGANVGNVTAKIAKTGATVYAFEPNPYAYRVLRQRFHGILNVHCINKGVLDREGKVRLYLHENADADQVHWSTGSSLLDFKGNVNPETSVEIDVLDLARFIADLGRFIALVKIDVEGVECRIVNRLIDTGLIERVGLLVVETHENKIPELTEPTEKLRRRIAKEGLENIRLDWI